MINTCDVNIGDKVEATIHEGYNCTPRNVIVEVVDTNFLGVFVKLDDMPRTFIHKGNVVRIIKD